LVNSNTPHLKKGMLGKKQAEHKSSSLFLMVPLLHRMRLSLEFQSEETKDLLREDRHRTAVKHRRPKSTVLLVHVRTTCRMIT
jgi:hypothetical protein